MLDRFEDRFTGIFGVFASLGGRPRPPVQANVEVVVGIFEDLLRPELDRLRVPPATVFGFVRLVAFASAMPHFGGTTGLDTTQLAALVVHGIARDDAEHATSGTAASDPEPTDSHVTERASTPC